MTFTMLIMAIVIFYQYFVPIATDTNSGITLKNSHISIPGIILISFMIFFSLLSSIINLISSYEIIYFYTAMLFLSLLLKHNFRRKILQFYLIIIVILSILSILIMFLAIFTDYLGFFPHIKVSVPLISDFYFVSSIIPTLVWFRNQSIFWEPGAFGFHLIFAILLAYKSRNKFFITILILTGITTFSTTVLIVLVLLGIYHIFFGEKRLKMFIIILSILTVSLTVIFIVTGNFFIPQLIIQSLIHKFSPSGSGYVSYVSRTLFSLEAFKMFLDNIFIGAGHYATAVKLEVVKSGATVNTSGLAGLLAELGLFGVFCIFLYIRFFWKFGLIAIPIALIWLNGEFLQYSPLAIFILADSADDFANKIFPQKVNLVAKLD